MLIVYDRLFGTYRAERDDVPCRYGLVTPLVTYNPLVVEFNQWGLLARDLFAARSLRAVLGHLLMPPGWSPHGPGTTTEALRARATADAALAPKPEAAEAPAAVPAAVVAGAAALPSP